MNVFKVTIPAGKHTEVATVRAIFQKAIDDCWLSGGGRVVVPAGEYIVSSVQLRDNVILDMQDGCVLISPTNIEDFIIVNLDKSRFTGKFIHDFCGIITAFGCVNAAVRGGRIVGRGQCFWTPMDTIGEAWRSTPPRYWANNFRPLTLLFHRCDRISVYGTKIEDSPVHSAWVSDCKDVTFRDVTVLNDIYGPNTDGLHFFSCIGVLVDGCYLVTGDDAIGVDGLSTGYSANTVIRNCTFDTTVNVIRVFTGLDPDIGERKLYSSVKNLVMHDCKILNASGVINISAQYGDISGLEFFNLDIHMDREGTPLFLMTDCGTISGVTIKKLTVYANGIGTIIGTKTHAIRDITIEDCEFAVRPMKKLYELDIPDPIPNYAMHHFAPCNLLVRHARGVKLKKVSVRWEHNPAYQHNMSAVTIDDADDTTFDHFAAEPYGDSALPVIYQKQSVTQT